MRAIIYIGHGSRNDQRNQAFINKITPIINNVSFPIQKIAFLEAKPSLMNKIDQCILEGATEIIVVPIFLLPGIHVNQDIPAIINEKKTQYPSLTVYYAPPFNDADDLIEDITERIATIPKVIGEDKAIIVISHGSRNTKALVVFERLITKLQKHLHGNSVFPAYLKSQEPSLEQCLTDLENGSYKDIIVVPHFFNTTMFPKKIETIVDEANFHHVALAPAIEFNEKIEQVIKKQIALASKVQ
ncbi:sirohydrochlorin chelatase [Paraliobacillus ryukyuensis]|uniref:sirohydrochlorin chelatase n=1 Tax=Paraliobacillus ryukyuensis TaxID=200904 RepID=UPI0009A82BDC|nr:sirohydrochlorin chelatase [Paraliobacillus ryukyuensis]